MYCALVDYLILVGVVMKKILIIFILSLMVSSAYAQQDKLPPYATKENMIEIKKEAEDRLKINPNDAGGYALLGGLYFAQGNLDAAEKEHLQAIKLEPNNASFHTNLGLVYSIQKKLSKAEKELKKAIELDANIYRAHNELGVVYLSRGELDKAEDMLNQEIKLYPSDYRPYLNLSIIYVMKNNIGLTKDYLKKAIDCADDRHTTELHMILGEIYYSEDNFSQAQHQVEAALKLKLNDAKIHYLLAYIYSAQNNTNAVKEFKEVISLDPNHADAHSILRENYYDNYHFDLAKKELEIAVKLNPKDTIAIDFLKKINKKK